MWCEGALNVMSAGTPYPRHGAQQRHQEEWRRSEDIREMLLETLLLALFRSLDLAVHLLQVMELEEWREVKEKTFCPESSPGLPFLAC